MNHDAPIRIAAVSGSLRKQSINAAALRAAAELAPAGVTVETIGIGDIPLYNEDVRQAGLPGAVVALRRAVAAADGVLLVTPEYNYSVPGVLKNAIDWASRPPEQPFDGKPVAIMGASPSALGTARAQYHLRQVFVFLNAQVMNRPEVMIARATDKFDDRGVLVDEATREFLAGFMVAFAEWIRTRPR